jgi:pyrroloquinoline-quinone synthase
VDIEKRAAILAVVEEALEGRRLLSHPFYQRWSHGELRREELGAYAAQYRFIEAGLPRWLGSIQSHATSPVVRDLVQRNLDDEVGGDSPRALRSLCRGGGCDEAGDHGDRPRHPIAAEHP